MIENTEIKANELGYNTYNTTLEIPITITVDGKYFVAISEFGPFSSFVAQGESEQEVKEKFLTIATYQDKFLREERIKLNKRAIFLGNYHRTKNSFQFWFQIVGINVTIRYNNNPEVKKMLDKIKNKNPNTLRLGNFSVSIYNLWNIK